MSEHEPDEIDKTVAVADDGWTGHDTLLRWLRAIVALALTGMMAWEVMADHQDLAEITVLMIGLLVVLGFEHASRRLLTK